MGFFFWLLGSEFRLPLLSSRLYSHGFHSQTGCMLAAGTDMKQGSAIPYSDPDKEEV